MSSKEKDVQTPCLLNFKKFYIKKVIINRKPQFTQNLNKDKAKIAFGCNIKTAFTDRFEPPAQIYDKKYTCVDKHSGVPLIKSPRNGRTKSLYEANEKIKKHIKSDEHQNSKSLSLCFQSQNNNQNQLKLIHLEPHNYLNRLLPMTVRQLKESFVMNKHQSNHLYLEPQ